MPATPIIPKHLRKKQFCKNIDSSTPTKGGQLCLAWGTVDQGTPTKGGQLCLAWGTVDQLCLAWGTVDYWHGYRWTYIYHVKSHRLIIFNLHHFNNFNKRRNRLHLYKQHGSTFYILHTIHGHSSSLLSSLDWINSLVFFFFLLHGTPRLLSTWTFDLRLIAIFPKLSFLTFIFWISSSVASFIGLRLSENLCAPGTLTFTRLSLLFGFWK